MGGTCPQDPAYWCPLKTDECENLPSSCVLLTAARGGSEMLRKAGFTYIIREGKMVLQRIERNYKER